MSEAALPQSAVAALVRLSAALSAGRPAALEGAVDTAAAQAPASAVEETLLQSYLFLGYPAALRGMAVWRERTGARPDARPDDWTAWQRRGETVCRQVYGEQYERLRQNIGRLHPDLDRWMVIEGYGKVLGRPGLPLKVRELCIVGLLSGLDAEPQLHSHLRGALRVGASPAEVEAALDAAADVLPPVRVARARAVWAAVASG